MTSKIRTCKVALFMIFVSMGIFLCFRLYNSPENNDSLEYRWREALGSFVLLRQVSLGSITRPKMKRVPDQK